MEYDWTTGPINVALHFYRKKRVKHHNLAVLEVRKYSKVIAQIFMAYGLLVVFRTKQKNPHEI